MFSMTLLQHYLLVELPDLSKNKKCSLWYSICIRFWPAKVELVFVRHISSVTIKNGIISLLLAFSVSKLSIRWYGSFIFVGMFSVSFAQCFSTSIARFSMAVLHPVVRSLAGIFCYTFYETSYSFQLVHYD